MDPTKLQQELEHEMKRQMPLYREWERNKDSEAAFMVQALMLKAADVATSAITWKKETGVGTAIISAYGLVDLVGQVAQKYTAQAPDDRLEWWHHVMSGMVRSDVEVAIKSMYTHGVTLIMRCMAVAKPGAGMLSAVTSLVAGPVVAWTLEAILEYMSTAGEFVLRFLEILNRFATRCVLNVLLKSAAARPLLAPKSAQRPSTSIVVRAESGTESGTKTRIVGRVFKEKLLLAFNNFVLTKAISKMTEAAVRAALDVACPDETMDAWTGRSWSVFRMLVMQIQSTGGPKSMRDKLSDPNGTLLADVPRTLRASRMVNDSEFFVAFIINEALPAAAKATAKGVVDIAHNVLRLALLYTFIECEESPFWNSETAIERAVKLGGGDGTAECVLGRMYHYGHGKPVDKKRAAELYKAAIGKGASRNVKHTPALRGLEELEVAVPSQKPGRETSEADLVGFAARRYIEEAFGVPLTMDAKSDAFLLSAALGHTALFESATAALIAHYELIADKQGWFGEQAAAAAKQGTMARRAARGMRLWHQFVVSAQCDRVVATHIRRALLSIPESYVLGSISEGMSEYVAMMCDLLTSACLFGIRTCLAASYDSSPVGPCLVREFPSGLALHPTGKVLGLGYKPAEQEKPACRMPTQVSFGAGEVAASENDIAEFNREMTQRRRLKAATRVVSTERAGTEGGGVPHATVRRFDGSEKISDVPCETMRALARSVVGDIMRVFRFEVHRWAVNDTVRFAIWKLDAEVQRGILWILAEFADAELALKEINNTEYKMSRFWGIFCVSPFLETLVDEWSKSFELKRSVVAYTMAKLADRLVPTGMRNVPISVYRRVDGHFAAMHEIIGVCMLAALRSVRYPKLYLVLPFLRHGERECRYV